MWHRSEKHKEQRLQCQQCTKKLGQCSLQEAEQPWVLSLPLSGNFCCSLCTKVASHVQIVWDRCQIWGGGKKCHLKQDECQFNPSFSCPSVPKGEAREVNKKPSTHQNKPWVRPWTWYQSQSFSQPFALLLSNREFCIHKQKLDTAFISERHFVKAAHSWRDEEGPLLHWHQTGFGRSAQQNTAAKYIELGAPRTTNTPAEALHRQHPPCYTHQSLTDINSFILCNLAFLPAESTSWTTSLLKSCSC